MRSFVRAALVVGVVLAVVACGGEDGRSAASWNQDGEAAATDGAGSGWGGSADGASAAPALAVEALEVTRGSLLQLIEGSGAIRGSAEVGVVSEVQGRIDQSDFDLGQFVEAGDVLLQVDDTIASLSVQEARGALESAQLDLSAAERRFEQGSASQAELTRARSAANGAAARFEAALKNLRDHTIRAPISGFVASRASDTTPGNYLNRGVPVARIVDLRMLEVEISVGERELQYLREGLPVSVSIPACGNQSFAAEIDAIAAGADPRTGSFAVSVSWENVCETARSGMTASVSIEPFELDTALVVPSAAIRQAIGQSFVFVADAGQARRQEILIGERLGDRVLVTDGLREGDVIVTSALTALTDGSSIEVTVRGQTGDVL